LMAQPTAATTAAAPPPALSAADKVAVARAIGLVDQENLCLTPISLKVKDATVEEIVKQVQDALPTKTSIEVRHAGAARFTFDLQKTALGQVLEPAAQLAGCKLFVLSDRLLIAPVDQLTEKERKEGGEWSQSVAAGGSRWSADSQGTRLLLKAITPGFYARLDANAKNNLVQGPDAKPIDRVSVKFAELSPDSQQILQKLYLWAVRMDQRMFPQALPMVDLSAADDVELRTSDKGDHLSVSVKGPSLPASRICVWGVSR